MILSVFFSFFFSEAKVYIFSSTFQLSEEKSWDQYFGTDVIQSIDDILFTSSSQRFVFNEETLYVIDTEGSVTETVTLSNNGNKNIYKSNNFSARPNSITAACEVDAEQHLFLSNKDIYIFNFIDKVWQNRGMLLC